MDIQLPPYLAQIAKETLGESEESRRQCIPKLRAMLQNQMGEFREIYKTPDDLFLLRFLRVSKFNINKAYDRIRSYYEVRKRYKADFDKVNLLEILPILDLKILQILPQKKKGSETVVYVNLKHFDHKMMTIEQLFRGIIFVEMDLQENQVSQIVGTKGILNFQGFGLDHIMHLTPPLLIKWLACSLKLVPAKISALHYLNMPSLFRLPLQFVRSLTPPKLRSRLVIHGSDIRSLHDFIDPSDLPSELEGTGEDINVEKMVRRLVSNFPEEIKYSLELSEFDPSVNYSDPYKHFPNHFVQKYYHIIREVLHI